MKKESYYIVVKNQKDRLLEAKKVDGYVFAVNGREFGVHKAGSKTWGIDDLTTGTNIKYVPKRSDAETCVQKLFDLIVKSTNNKKYHQNIKILSAAYKAERLTPPGRKVYIEKKRDGRKVFYIAEWTDEDTGNMYSERFDSLKELEEYTRGFGEMVKVNF